METPTSFGLWLKRRRKALDLTQASLARCVGCSVVTIEKIEADERRPSRQMAELIAGCLEIAPEDRSTFLKVARAELRVDRLAKVSSVELGNRGSRDASSRHTPWHNLPIPATPLLGREAELARISQLLINPQCRLLTLIGLGGIGKTHLALEAAFRQREAFRDGVYFISLAPISSTTLIVATIADALGFTFYGPEPPQKQLLNHLHQKEILLLLDNFEHLLPHRNERESILEPEKDKRTITMLADVLLHAPGVKLLVTSRERLNLQGEWLLEIEGLPFPKEPTQGEAEVDHITLTQFPAVALFVNSGQRVYPNFELTEQNQAEVIRICRLLEGMPLGLILAAAWLRVLSCREIADEIERNLDFLTTTAWDVPERQRSLRAAFDYSWKLLLAEEQRVMKQLSIFRGDFQRTAAEQVTDASLPILLALVDKSLLHLTEAGRYSLHELIRQYAAAKLQERPEELETTQDRHSAYFVNFVCLRDASLKGAQQLEALAEISAEIENIRLGWRHAVVRSQAAAIQAPLQSFWIFYEIRGWFQEAEALFGWALEKLSGPRDQPGLVPMVLREQIRSLQGWFCLRLGQHEKAQVLLQQSLNLLRSADDQAILADTLTYLGVVTYRLGDYAGARHFLEEGLAIKRTLDDKWSLTLSLSNLGIVAQLLGEYTEAQRLFRECLTVARAAHDSYRTTYCLALLGDVTARLGQYTEAQSLLQESLALSRVVNDRWSFGFALGQLGLVHQLWGNHMEAQRLFYDSLMLFQEIGDRWNTARLLNYLGSASLERGTHDEAQHYFLEALKMASEARAIHVALSALVGLAAVQKENLEQALELLVHAMSHPASSQIVKARAERLRVELEAALSRQQIEAIQARAQAKSFEVITKEMLEMN